MAQAGCTKSGRALPRHPAICRPHRLGPLLPPSLHHSKRPPSPTARPVILLFSDTKGRTTAACAPPRHTLPIPTHSLPTPDVVTTLGRRPHGTLLINPAI
eukprot:scaffold4708_cov128-Isochrysis_galbana.AAC.2